MLNGTFGFTDNDYLVNQEVFTRTQIEQIESGTASPDMMEKYEEELKKAKPLVAPQANAMVAVIEPIMAEKGEGSNKVFLYIIGAVIALLLNWLNISPLAFALGMYLPLHLNTPLIVGGLVAHFVNKSSKDKKVVDARMQRGTLIASGFIAGAAIFGIIGALLMNVVGDMNLGIWEHSDAGFEWLALVAFALLVLYMRWDTYRAKVDD
jgi:hypothetical protein